MTITSARGPDGPCPTAPSERWGRIPAWWLDHADLDADGLAVLAALATYADEHGICWPSQATLAAKLKRSRPTVNRILQRLHDIGLVVIEHRRGRDGARLSCLYRLRFTRTDDPARETPSETPSEAGVVTVDRDDSPANAPCPAASQEQVHSEQNPDSLAGPAGDALRTVGDDWVPSCAELAWARARFGDVDLARHVEGFVLRCQAHGYRYRDVGAAWRAWLSQDVASGKAPPIRTTPPSPAGVAAGTGRSADTAAAQRLGAWMAAAEYVRAVGPVPAARP